MSGEERVRVREGQKRVRAYLDGRGVLDTARALLVWEVPYYPAYYIPAPDVAADLKATGDREQSDDLGEAEIFDVSIDGRVAPAAARRYPSSPVSEIRDHIRFDWDAMTEWLEEDEPVYTHPRDPYSRVDILHSSRHVKVAIDGVTIAESKSPTILFETGLPPRFYFSPPDVRMELFRPSGTETGCPYKGTAAYWSVEIEGRLHEDLAWVYRTPLPESQKIAGLIAFYNERIDLEVDGELQERPRTKFST